jgi:hypothetical protein
MGFRPKGAMLVGNMLQLFIGAGIPPAALTLWSRSISLALVGHAIAGSGHVGGLYAAIFFSSVALYNLKGEKPA